MDLNTNQNETNYANKFQVTIRSMDGIIWLSNMPEASRNKNWAKLLISCCFGGDIVADIDALEAGVDCFDSQIVEGVNGFDGRKTEDRNSTCLRTVAADMSAKGDSLLVSCLRSKISNQSFANRTTDDQEHHLIKTLCLISGKILGNDSAVLLTDLMNLTFTKSYPDSVQHHCCIICQLVMFGSLSRTFNILLDIQELETMALEQANSIISKVNSPFFVLNQGYSSFKLNLNDVIDELNQFTVKSDLAIINISDIQDRIKMPGSGTQGKVYKVTYNNETVVYKKFLTDASKPIIKNFFCEVLSLHRLHGNDNIVKILACITNGELGIVEEFVDGTTLDKWNNEEFVTRCDRLKVAKEIIDAMAYIHKCGIIHLDLKPQNIMIRNVTNSVKIIDFGLARITFLKTFSKQSLGTFVYLSPEQLNYEGYMKRFNCRPNCQADVFSFGTVLCEMLNGKIRTDPIGIIGKLTRAVDNPDCHHVNIVDEIKQFKSNEPQLAALIEQCWAVDGKERPLFVDLKPIFEGLIKSTKENQELIFTCPITCEKFKDPVVAEDGFTYERTAIEEYLLSKGRVAPSPLGTGDTISMNGLRPNKQLKLAVEALYM